MRTDAEVPDDPDEGDGRSGRPPDESGSRYPADADPEAAARGGLYALAARAFTEPDPELYEAIDSGALDAECRALVERSGLDLDPPDLTTGDDRERLCARYNDLFVVGHTVVEDRTDGTIDAEGPSVSLYESAYRPDASWTDVNLDLARVYDYFGVGVDEERRENHDHLRLQLEFAGFLCRREAAVDEAGARTRLDFLDRHLAVCAEGVAGALADEPGTDVFGELADFVDRLVRADTAELDGRTEGV